VANHGRGIFACQFVEPHLDFECSQLAQRNPAKSGDSSGICQNYILDTEADVTIFSNDGLDVRLFDTRKYMFGSSLEMDDWVHPNELGQFELSHSVEASW
jgi:hypothetical protein